MDLLRSIFKGDKVIWIIFLFLCLISIIEVFSAASTLTYKSGDHWGPITQHSILLMVGAVIVVLVHNIPYKWFQVFPIPLLAISCLLLAIVMATGFFTGDRVNGAARWMSFMGIQFQPSEIAKMAVIIATASILARGQNEDGANPKAFKRIMLITCLVCGLILPENYSTGMLLFGTVYLMMFIGRVPAKKLIILGGGILAFIVLFVTFLLATPNDTLEKIPMGHRFTTVKSRIADFSGKEEIPAAKFDIDGDGQVAHARIAVATSNLIGKGPGNSVQRDFLSQAFSDFIYAIIIEELGLLGGFFVVFLYICLLIRVGRIAKKMRPDISGFPYHRDRVATRHASIIQHDGCRRTRTCYRTTAASHQQGWYIHLYQLRLYRHDIKRQPLYGQIGGTASARCTNPYADRYRRHRKPSIYNNQ